LWPETRGKRGANEIGTCLLFYLQSLDPDVKHVTIYSDCCSGQNRNQYVCALLLYAVHKLNNIDVIDHKFLIPGHTMMECDSMHSAIEHAQRHLAIYSLHEWVNVIKSARRYRPYAVKSVEVSDFKNLKSLAAKLVKNRRNLTSGGEINWLNIRWIRVMKDHPNMIFLKTDFDQAEFDCLSQPKQEWQKLQLTKAYRKELPISAAKYADLITMVKKEEIPKEYSDFYTCLPHDNKTTKDMTPEMSDDDNE